MATVPRPAGQGDWLLYAIDADFLHVDNDISATVIEDRIAVAFDVMNDAGYHALKFDLARNTNPQNGSEWDKYLLDNGEDDPGSPEYIHGDHVAMGVFNGRLAVAYSARTSFGEPPVRHQLRLARAQVSLPLSRADWQRHVIFEELAGEDTLASSDMELASVVVSGGRLAIGFEGISPTTPLRSAARVARAMVAEPDEAADWQIGTVADPCIGPPALLDLDGRLLAACSPLDADIAVLRVALADGPW
ncbi:MAG: hypothetical protein ABI743_06845 [bacterium]